MARRTITQEQLDFINWTVDNIEFSNCANELQKSTNPSKKRIRQMFSKGRIHVGNMYGDGSPYAVIGRALIKRYGHLYKPKNKEL